VYRLGSLEKGGFTTLDLTFAFAHFGAEWAVEFAGMMRSDAEWFFFAKAEAANPRTANTSPIVTLFGITDISTQNMGRGF
jgi:hypothetical protein